MTSYDLGVRDPSRRAALCSAGPRPFQERGAETGTPATWLRQGLKAPDTTSPGPLAGDGGGGGPSAGPSH